MRWIPTLAILALSCGSDSVNPSPNDPTAGIDPDCDPIVPEHCGFPFPSDRWLAGGHVAFGKGTLPKPKGMPIDPSVWADADGFSAGQSPMTFFPGATATGLPGQNEIAKSVTVDSPTILMNAGTGELVAHFSEIDMSTFHDDDRAVLIRPAVRLADKQRYIVAIRRLTDADGKPIAPSPAFKALRDTITTPNAAFEARRPHFEEIFAALEKKGIARADLQIAWDYTTASRESNTSALLAMRDDALKTVGAMGPEYTITKTETDPNMWIAKRLTGMMKVPLYLDKPGPGGRIVRGTDGVPKQNGTAEYEFVVHVPKSATAQSPASLLQNGHGLLGSKSEGQDSYLATMCGKYGYVAIAVDWVGMAHDDVETITNAVATGDVGQFKAAVDRQHQGFVNALLAMRMLSGRLAADPALVGIVDPTKRFYRGDSQGGIFGATYMAISTDVTRGLLGEPGMPYNLLLDRSVDFAGFKFLLKGALPNGLDVQLALGLVQMIWDRTEPSGYAAYTNRDLFPGTPKHDILIHAAIGDHQVTTLGAHVIARAVGAMNLKPVNRSIWGIPEADSIAGSAIVEFDFGLKEQFVNLPTTDGMDPHGTVRGLDVAQKMVDQFFRTGVVTPTCNGPCNPE